MTQLDKARQEIARNNLKMERDRLIKRQKDFERTICNGKWYALRPLPPSK